MKNDSVRWRSCTCVASSRAAMQCLLIAVTWTFCGGLAQGEGNGPKLPPIIVSDADGMSHQIPDDKLYIVERELQRQVTAEDGPTEIIVFATSRVGDWMFAGKVRRAVRHKFVIAIYGDRGRVQQVTEYGAKASQQKEVPVETVKSIQQFITDNSVDRLPPLGNVRESDGTTIYGGSAYVFLHLTRNRGYRVSIHKQRMELGDEATSRYSKVVKFFEGIAKQYKSE